MRWKQLIVLLCGGLQQVHVLLVHEQTMLMTCCPVARAM